MVEFREIMALAEDAKRRMIVNYRDGKAAFDSLLADHPYDGMLYFKRAEAQEARGNMKKALADYRKAKAFFPMANWKDTANHAISRLS